jgi:hypothetical protein
MDYTDKVKVFAVVIHNDVIVRDVIPAKAGIHEDTGFRVKPGMTN